MPGHNRRGRLRDFVRKGVHALGYDIVPFDPEIAVPLGNGHAAVAETIALPDIPSVGCADPLLEIVTAPQFAEAAQFFARMPPWRTGFVNSEALALLYYAIRILRPASIVEIGTNKGWTTQVLARAVQANGCGSVHTVGPYDKWRFEPIFAQWPAQLRKLVQFHPMNSAAFFQSSLASGVRYDLILIDGNHDYEFVLFDIQCAARVMIPGGYVFIDDADQPAVQQAAVDFLTRRPSWINCTRPERSDILAGRELLILQAPAA